MDVIVEHCPRCLARSGRVSELRLSGQAHVFSPVPAGEPPESLLKDSSETALDEAAEVEIDASTAPKLDGSPHAALEESAEAEIELPSVPQLG